MLRFAQKSRQNEVNIPNCALLVFKSGNIYLDEIVYTGIPKYKQIIQQKLKLSENHAIIILHAHWSTQAKSRKYRGIFEVHSPEKQR